jgi:DNA-binding CsgD family transcriptional regulator
VTRGNHRVHIRQLCCLGLPSEQLMPALLKAVRQFVDADSAGFFWVDARGDMTSLYAERLLPAPVRKLYFERYYDSGASSFKRAFTERVQGQAPVIAVSISAAVERSPYYNDVFRLLDAHHVLYGIVREQGEAIGQLSLYRPKSAPAFSAAQRADLSSVMPYVAHGVSHRSPRGTDRAEFVDTEDDAVFLIGVDGGIRQLSAKSERLLALATLGKIGPDQMLSGIEETARPALRRLAERLGAVLSGAEGGPPSLIVHNAWGRFLLRAYSISDAPLKGDTHIAIRIKRQETMLLKFVEALSGLELSPQQREAAVGLAKGLSNRELADAMGVSINTVAYHLKQLFQRLDTHDRQQMVTKVLGTHG